MPEPLEGRCLPITHGGSTPMQGLGTPGAGGHPETTRVEMLDCQWLLLDFWI